MHTRVLNKINTDQKNNPQIEALKTVSSASIWLAQYALLLQSYPSAEGEKQLMPGVSFPNGSTVNQALSTSEALLSSLQLVKSSLADLNAGKLLFSS